MKENQELSHKQDETQHQDSIKNMSTMDDGDKIVEFCGSATMKANQGEYEYQDSTKNFESLSLMVDDEDETGDSYVESEKLGLSGREKLKRHWREVGDRVFVPERWEHEGSLKEWMDCSSFDKILAPKELKSAREALMSQGKRGRSSSGSNSTSRMLEIKSG